MFMSETSDGLISLNAGVTSGVGLTLASLSDVTITGVGADHTLRYDAGSAKWLNTGNFKVSSTGKAHVGIDSTQGGEASIYGLSVSKDVLNGGGGSQFAFAGEIIGIDSSNDTSGAQHLTGLQTAAIATSAANYHELWGIHAYSTVSIGGTTDLAIGTYTQTSQTAGTLSYGVGAEVDVLRTGGTMTNAIGLAVSYHSTHAANIQGMNAVATNQYGVKVGPIVSGTLNYAWYSEYGKSFFKDQVGIGTDAPAGNGLYVVPITLGGTTQQAIAAAMIGSSEATVGIIGIGTSAGTSAASFTASEVIGLRVFDATKGAGSTITTQVGLDILNQTKGINNFALRTGTGRSNFGDVVVLSGSLRYISFGGDNIGYFQCDSDPKFIWSLNNTTRMHLTTSALNPTSVGGLTLGTASLPWNNTYVQGLLVFSGTTLFSSLGAVSGKNASFEFGRQDGIASTPFIDFHSSSAPVDYDSRIIAASGTGLAGGGNLSFLSGFFDFNNEIRINNTSNSHLEFYLNSVRQAGLSVISSDIIRFTDNAGTVKLQYNMGGTTGKFVPPATSISFRNNADTQDNLLIEEDGTITIKNQLKFITGNATSLGTHDNFGLSFKTNALVRLSFDTSGNLVADTTNGGYITYRAGTSSSTAKTTGILFASAGPTTTSTTTATLTGGSNGGIYTLKANTLATSGDSLWMVYNGAVSTATTASFSLLVSGIALANALGLTSNGTFLSQAWITRSDSTHIYWAIQDIRFSGTAISEINRSAGTVVLDLTMDQTIKFQGSVVSGTVTGYLCQITHQAAQ